MTTPQIALPSKWRWGRGYGYLWWLGKSDVAGHDVDWAAGFGLGGQRLYVVPSLDLVVAVNAGDYVFHDPQGRAGATALDGVLAAASVH